MTDTDDPEITAAGPAEPEPIPLPRPADGVPPVSVSTSEIARAAEKLAIGTGPFAVDAERASGFRYSNRAYLIQIRRAGAGTVLIDPVNHGGSPIDVLKPLADVLADGEWILHAADQDLPCLAEVGLHPPALYDTELAGRLAGFDRVNLAAMVQRLLGLGLAKGHGAADWSKRPLPEDWLNYAALDVEVLIELRTEVAAVLAQQNKTGWAAEEFEYLRRAESTPTRRDRWRRTSGLTRFAPRQAWLRCVRCGPRGIGSPATVISRPGAFCPTRRSSPPHWPTPRRSRNLRPCRSSADPNSGAPPACGWRHWRPRGIPTTRPTPPKL
jgi:ribonuclease D